MDEFYKSVKLLSHGLTSSGHENFSKDIDTCIVAGGSSGGEIVMCLRVIFKKVEDDIDVPEALRLQATQLINAIGKTGW